MITILYTYCDVIMDEIMDGIYKENIKSTTTLFLHLLPD